MRVKPATVDVPAICVDLQNLQRQRAAYLKSRIMVGNRLRAIVAGTIGYHSGMKPKERAKVQKAADELIKRIRSGEEHELSSLVNTHYIAVDAFDQMAKGFEKAMLILARQLPVAEWVGRPEQRGFGLPLLAVIIGETGDLSNYANPAKLWRRLGCAPFTKDGKTMMGSTWRCGKEGKLNAADWTEFGYSPRRRSVAYLIGGCLLKAKQNGTVGVDDVTVETEARVVGPYRLRYEESKATIAEKHPDYIKNRCHFHGMLLMTKLLLKNLLLEWQGHPPMTDEQKKRAGL